MSPPSPSPVLRLGDVDIHLDSGRLMRQGQTSSLSPRECAVLRYLSRHAGHPVSRETLLTEVWGMAPSSASRVLDVTISSLRKQIESDPRHPRFLLSIRGLGYQLERPDAAPTRFTTAAGVIDLLRGEFRTEGTTLPLTNREVQLLTILAQHQDHVARQFLVEQMGLDSTTALKHVLRRLRGKVGEEVLTSKRGAGVRLETVNQPLSPLPALTPAFQGRSHEEEEVLSKIQPGAWVTLVAPGGFGKTQLAVRIANKVPTAIFCELSACRTEPELLRAIARQMQITTEDATLFQAIAYALEAPALLVLDNCEQLEPGALDAIRDTIRQRPSAALCTSRSPLGGAHEIRLKALDRESAVALFLDRASLAAGRPVTFQDPHAIVAVLEGIPLAIELAASLAARVDEPHLLQHLKDPIRLPQTSGSGRHHSLWAAVTWSWQLLSTNEQRAFAASSSFAGGFPLTAAGPVLGDHDGAICEGLVHQSMLTFASGRFQHHGLLWSYARARFEEARSPQSTEKAHATWARGLVDPEGWFLQRVAEPTMLAERENIEAALARQPEAGLALGLAMCWLDQGPAQNVIPLLQKHGDPTQPWAQALLAIAFEQIGDEDQSMLHATRSLVIAQKEQNKPVQVRMLLCLARGAHRTSASGDDYLTEATTLAKNLGLPDLVIDCALEEASFFSSRWQIEQAKGVADQAQGLLTDHTAPSRTLRVLQRAASCDLQLNNPETGLKLGEWLANAPILPPSRHGQALMSVARSHMALAHWGDANKTLRQAVSLLTRAGAEHQANHAWLMLAHILHNNNEHHKAIAIVSDQVSTQDGFHRLYQCMILGGAKLSLDQLGEAKDAFEDMLRLATELSVAPQVALAHQKLARVAALRGELKEARLHLRHARESDDGSHPNIALVNDEEEVRLLMAEGDLEGAHTLMKRIDTHPARHHNLAWKGELDRLQTELTALLRTR